MSELIEFHNDVRFFENIHQSLIGSGIVTGAVPGMSKSILKFKPYSVCEVFGYQIANLFGVRVPQMQGVWTREPMRIRTGFVDAGRIGIFVNYFEDWRPVDRRCAVELDPLQVARALALCAFDRFEWGEFGLSDGSLYFVDLERLLPPIQPEVLFAASREDRMEQLHDLEVEYRNNDDSAIREVFAEAERIGLQDQVEQKLKQLCCLRPSTYYQFLEISGHPLDRLLSCFMTSVFGNRLNSIAEWFDLPTHEVPAWHR